MPRKCTADNRWRGLLLAALLVGIWSCDPSGETATSHPNIVYILADDLGFGDISLLNPRSKIKTENIDALGINGMTFRDAHSGSAVCTPTRYGVLTGRYAWRTHLKRGVLWSWDQPLIAKNRTTVASLLKEHGYHTGCIGKWHLGLGWQSDTAGVVDIRKPILEGPNDNGFDYFFGITASLDIPPYIYLENDRSTTQHIDTIAKVEGKSFWRAGQIGEDLTHASVLPKLTEKAVAYIDEQADSEDPFFLYFPLPAPHTPIVPTEPFRGKSGTNAYGDFVLQVDDVVRQVVSALEANGIKDNTLVIFTSDNGCSPMADFEELATYGHHPSGPYRGHKADIYEGGHRVPFFAQWPDRITAGATSDQTVCLTDLLASCAEIVGDTLADNEGEDSYSMVAQFDQGAEASTAREATVHHSINGSFAIRRGPWKLALCPGSGGWSYPRPREVADLDLPPVQLFNLQTDEAEQTNLALQHPDIVQELGDLMQSYIDLGRSTPGPPQENDTETLLYLER